MLEIRPAAAEDGLPAAELILLSTGGLGNYLLGLGQHARALAATVRLFAYPDNRFSFTYTHLATWDEQIAGLILAFPGGMINPLTRSLLRPIRRIYSIGEMARLGWRAISLIGGKETEVDEYYIAHLAVGTGFQRRGIGQALLDYAESEARHSGLRKCSLVVDLDNLSAQRLYERSGYQTTQVVNTPDLSKVAGTRGYQRMVKSIQ